MDGRQRYPLSRTGIILFGDDSVSPKRRPNVTITTKSQPPTQPISNIRIRVSTSPILIVRCSRPRVQGGLGTVAELCCGRGEALAIFGSRVQRYIGIDISETMLEATLKKHHHPSTILLQADAIRVPLAAESVDTVVMLGGIHHVPQRERLFLEVARILKPGGRFVYREPVSDFWLWRALRAVIYWLSPMLNHETERPLQYQETVPVMERAGLKVASVPHPWTPRVFVCS